MDVLAPQVHQWTRDEYYTMAEAGLFDGRHVELIGGEVIEMSPQGSPHITAITLVAEQLKGAFSRGFFVRVQGPLTLGPHSEPEPDVAVIEGNVRDYTRAHPSTAALIVEVSDSSLAYDRHEKASLYARVGIAEYWIVNLIDAQLEVFRRPVEDAASPFGWTYTEKFVRDADADVTPLAAPEAALRIADLLP